MAELPDSVKQLSPNETRNVEAAYLHCGLDKGSLVQAKVRVDGNLELVQFNARNLRPITPLAWKLDLCEGFVTKLETDDRPQGYVQDQTGNSEQVKQDKSVSFDDLPVEEQRKLKGESLDVKVRKLVSPGVKERSKKGPGVFIRRETPVVEGTRVESKGPSQSPQGSPHSDGRIDVPLRRAGEESEESSEVPKFLPTRNCPSCETGMNAPGTRHTAQCKRRFAEFQEAMQKQRRVELEGVGSEQSSPVTPVPAALAESPQPMEVGTEVPPVPHFTAGTSAEYRQRFKRPAETETEDLEREIQESSAAMVGTVGDESFDRFWVETGEAVLISSMFLLEGAASFCPATAPNMFREMWNPSNMNPTNNMSM